VRNAALLLGSVNRCWSALVNALLPDPTTLAVADFVVESVKVPQKRSQATASVERRLMLDDERSWAVLTEANRFIWPDPDLRLSTPGDSVSVGYGPLPFALFEEIRTKFIAAVQAKRASFVPRSE
jgi:hypothetical protein